MAQNRPRTKWQFVLTSFPTHSEHNIGIETISAVALGIGLSASSGFRVFIPLLIAGIASRFGFVPLGETFAWMATTPALICFGVAAVVEVLAYYIPFVDNILDSISTPLAVGAGTLLMTSVFPAESEWVKWVMGFLIGGGTAATIQGGSVLARLGSSQFTGGLEIPWYQRAKEWQLPVFVAIACSPHHYCPSVVGANRLYPTERI